MQTIDTDYLVVGAGTSGLAFADTLISQSDAHVTIVDRHGLPGGHWNDAYPFVTLHQPSAFYGVNSLPLGSGRIDSQGLNAGLYELASGAEINAYFGRVMQHTLLPSGRVSYHPMCEMRDDGCFDNLLSGERVRVNVRRKIVDAYSMGPEIPATHTPRFAVEPGAQLVPPNALPGLWQRAARAPRSAGSADTTLPRHYVVIGAGKTAMDACLWLLGAGAPASAITWVKPRESWLVNRLSTQPGPEFFFDTIGSQADQMAAFGAATSLDDLFLRLEACGALLRIDPSRQPTMFHLATVSTAEVARLRTLHQVVRGGHVHSIGPGRMRLAEGAVAVPPDALFIDCTASAVRPRPVQPIFQDGAVGKIVLQLVRLPQPAFSAAAIAYVEAHDEAYADTAAKNAVCATVPFPHTLADYPRSVAIGMQNQFRWGQDKALRQWMRDSRLDGFGRLMSSIAPDDTARQAVLARYKAGAMAAMANLPRLMA
jgi:NAD(P)-binding Rossmann-like domain